MVITCKPGILPRVLILSCMYPRVKNPYSGIFIHRQVKGLQASGCGIAVISPEPMLQPQGVLTVPRGSAVQGQGNYELVDGVPAYYPAYLNMPLRLFPRWHCHLLYRFIGKTVTRIARQLEPSVIHAHRAIPDGFIGLMLRERLRLPLVVSLRGSDVLRHPFISRRIFDLTEKVISEADQVVSVGRTLGRVAERIGTPRRSISVVYNGCDTQLFAYDKEVRCRWRQDRGVPRDSTVFIYVGNILKKKGVFDLINAFVSVLEQHPNCHLVLVGGGKDVGSAKKMTAKLGLEQVIWFVGARVHEEIPKWLSLGDVLVLPSYGEGLPNVALEAMSCQRPVVATRVGGIPEVVADGISGTLIEPHNTKALARAMSLLADDASLRKRMGNEGRKIVQQRFSPPTGIDKLLKIYEAIR